MPTPNKAIDTLLCRYGIDPRNDASVEQFFETLQKNFTEKEIEEIGDFLLAAESPKFDYVKMAASLPDIKADQKKSPPIPIHGAGTMNKTKLAATVALRAGLSKKVSAEVVDAVLDAIASSLRNSEEVRLVGFGTFSVSKRAARHGANPRTGEIIRTSASRQPKFKAGKKLKDVVN